MQPQASVERSAAVIVLSLLQLHFCLEVAGDYSPYESAS